MSQREQAGGRRIGLRSAEAWRAKGRGRLRALVALAVLTGVGAWLATVSPRAAPVTHLPPAALAAEAAPVGSQSSSWYCPGMPAAGTSGVSSHVVLVGTARRTVRATLTTATTGGAARQPRTITVPASSEVSVEPLHARGLPWQAERVDLAGGGVVASAVVDGPRGQSVAPCATETSSQWYFASGSTSGGSTLRVSLFDPTPVLAVVDLSFITASGTASPMTYQGIVVAPMAVLTETVGKYVQNQGSVATVVRARSGSVVADELQLFGPGGASGVALSLGVPSPETNWSFPRLVDAVGGTSTITVVNPTSVAEHVRVEVRVEAGPDAPLTEVVAPGASWQLRTSDQLRIPSGVPYAVTIRASGGRGVLVARAGAGSPKSRTGQWAQAVAVPLVQLAAPSEWVVPGVGTGIGAADGTEVIGIDNPASRPVRVFVGTLADRGSGPKTVTVEARSFASVTVTGTAVVSAAAPVALAGDGSAPGAPGVQEIPAVPRA